MYICDGEAVCSMCIGKMLPFYDEDIENTDTNLLPFDVTDSMKFEFIETLNNFQEREMELDPDYNLYGNINMECVYQEVEDFRTTNGNNMRLVCMNIRSAPKNIEQFNILMDPVFGYCPIIALTETWFNPDSAKLYFINDFAGFHTCRPPNKRGGGVSIFISELYAATYIKEISFSHPDIETIFVKMSKGNVLSDKGVIIGCIYRPPQGDIENFNNEIADICEFLNTSKDVIYLCGDINLDLVHSRENSKITAFLNIIATNDFIPTIDKPTRWSSSGSKTLIDNIFVKNHCQILHSGIVLTDISDHFLIYINILEQRKTYETNNISKRDFSNKNKKLFIQDVCQIDWSQLLSMKQTQRAYTFLHNKIREKFKKYFPIKTMTSKYKGRLPWLTESLKKDIQIKNKMYVRSKRYPTQLNIIAYKKFKRKLNKDLSIAMRAYFNRKLIEHKSNIKKYWETIKEIIKTTTKSKYPAYFNNDGTAITDDLDIANKFNDYFINIGPNLAKKIPQSAINIYDHLPGNYPQSFFLQPTCNEEIRSTVKSLNRAAPGWDELTHSTFLSISEFLEEPVKHIINLSFAEGVVPVELKIAKVMPLFKADDAHSFSNYRPISILPIISKIFEKLVSFRLIKYLTHYKILYNYQFGFREKHSTELALHLLNNYIATSFENKTFTLGIFLDFSKAFDTVNFEILLNKLNHYGIRGIPLKLFKNYLENREQHVTYKSTSSTNQTITTGVPQGSILGPLLFLIYINDLATVSPKLFSIIYADDSNLLLNGESPSALIKTANIELKKVVNWLQSNKLSLNIKKSKYMLFSRKGTTPIYEDKLCINNNEIYRVDQIKFLGYIIDEKLSWKPHINYVSLKISKNAAVLRKLKKHVNVDNIYNLYYSLVYPYLINGIAVWGASGITTLAPIVTLQKRVVRLLTNSGRLDHTVQLFKKLDILPLHCLYTYNILLCIYKVRNKLFPESFITNFKLNSDISVRNTRQNKLYFIPNFRTKYFENTVTVQGPKMANKFKILYETHCSIGTFKRSAKKLLLSTLD